MSLVAKALWFIESHCAADISLDDIARTCAASRYHLSRVFGDAVGVPIMNYVRGRRLTEAALALAKPGSEILGTALGAGYSSHEAFTRAFRDQFGVTPSEVRKRGSVAGMTLLHARRFDACSAATLDHPRVVRSGALRIAGLEEAYTFVRMHEVPAQWQRFSPYLGRVAGQRGSVAYGVRATSEGGADFTYLCGVEVSGGEPIAPPLTEVLLAERTYVVFVHRDHISTIRSTHLAIWNDWLQQLNVECIHEPDFERYDSNFNPHTGVGPVEIWIPIAPVDPQ